MCPAEKSDKQKHVIRLSDWGREVLEVVGLRLRVFGGGVVVRSVKILVFHPERYSTKNPLINFSPYRDFYPNSVRILFSVNKRVETITQNCYSNCNNSVPE